MLRFVNAMELQTFTNAVSSLVVGWLVVKIVYGLVKRAARTPRKTALRGKVVVITGASSGIGESLAHTFYELGCKVVLAARREAELNRVKNDLVSKKLNIKPEEPVVLRLDVADLKQIDEFADKVHELCGHVDYLINNAGIYFIGSLLNTKVQVHENLMYVNYFGTVALTKALLPRMVERKSGHVVFMSSVNGLISTPYNSAYCATKHAMQALADALRAEIHRYNIKVTTINPGYVNTPISLRAMTETGDKLGVMKPENAAGLSTEYLSKRALNAILDGDDELVVAQIEAHLGVFIRRWMPSVYFHLMYERSMSETEK